MPGTSSVEIAPRPTLGYRRRKKEGLDHKGGGPTESDLANDAKNAMIPGHGQPTPQIESDLAEALEEIPEEDQKTIMTILACTQEASRQLVAAEQKASQTATAIKEQAGQSFFAQHLIVRRADKGTLTKQDVNLARGIIQSQGAAGHVNRVSSGANALLEQGERLMDINLILAGRLNRLAEAGVSTQAMDTITRTMGREAGYLEHVQETFQASLENNEQARVQQIATGQHQVGLEGKRRLGTQP